MATGWRPLDYDKIPDRAAVLDTSYTISSNRYEYVQGDIDPEDIYSESAQGTGFDSLFV